MLNFDVAAYPVSTASVIAGINPGTTRSWLQKGWLRLQQFDLPAAVPGATAQLSPRRILQIAIAAKLVALGMHPEKACAAAGEFTDLSSGREAPGFSRDPGELFDGSFTYLAAYPDGEVKIIRTAGVKKRGADEVSMPTVQDLLYGSGQREGCWLIGLDFIVKRMTVELQKFDRGEVIG